MEVIEQIAKEAAMSQSEKKPHHTDCDRLFRYAEFLGFGSVHIKFDHATGLRAIVAIHNLNRGPAIGGARLIPYPSTDAALEDAMRLGYMMSFKAAISGLPHGGAKAVLMKPKVIKDRKAYLEAFANFINELDGRYITAVDSGTRPEDMDIIAAKTPYVTCTTGSGNCGDPSPQTAIGVRRGIEAAVKFQLGKNTLSGIHVAIQGVGNVGYYLAKELHDLGARLTICDVNIQAQKRCVEEFGAKIVSTDEIYEVPADVFSPCALGAVLNLNSIKRLKASIIAGSANNQLAHQHHGTVLHEKGILYAPDFVINSGGLIYVSAVYDQVGLRQALDQVGNIHDTLMEIFTRSKADNLSTSEIAEKIALVRLGGDQKARR